MSFFINHYASATKVQRMTHHIHVFRIPAKTSPESLILRGFFNFSITFQSPDNGTSYLVSLYHDQGKQAAEAAKNSIRISQISENHVIVG